MERHIICSGHLCSSRSEEISELERVHELDRCLGNFDNVFKFWLDIDSLGVDLDTKLLCLSLLCVVFLDTSLECLSALTSANMLNSDVNSLGDNSASVLLVNDNSDGMLSDIKNATSLSVVELVRHALVDRSVSDNVHEVSLLVSLHDFREMDWSVLSEALAEEVSCSCSISVAVRHLYFQLLNRINRSLIPY